jgi:hypothetical protein
VKFEIFDENHHLEEVKRLVQDEYKLNTLPERLGGKGVVGISDGIKGFAWALTASNSDIACVEYFVLHHEVRHEQGLAAKMMLFFYDELEKFGVKRIIGLLSKEAMYTKSLVRVFTELGMASGEGFVVCGDIGIIKKNMIERYKIYGK